MDREEVQKLAAAFGYCIPLDGMPLAEREELFQALKAKNSREQVLWSHHMAQKSDYVLVLTPSWSEYESLFQKYGLKSSNLSGTRAAFLHRPSEYLAKRLCEPLVKEGKKALKKGAKEDAKRLFALALAHDFSNAKLHFHLGKLLEEEKDWERAEFHLERFQELLPEKPIGWFLLGKISIEREHWEQAVERLERYLTLKEEDVKALALLGEAFLKLRQLEKAKAKLLRALELDPAYRGTYLPLAQCYFKMRNFERAKQIAKLGLERQPRSAELFYLLGRIYYLAGEVRKAKKQLKRALRYRPDFLDAYHLLGEVYQKGGDKKKAKKIFQKWELWQKHIDQYGFLSLAHPLPDESALLLEGGVTEEDDWDDLEEISLEDMVIDED